MVIVIVMQRCRVCLLKREGVNGGGEVMSELLFLVPASRSSYNATPTHTHHALLLLLLMLLLPFLVACVVLGLYRQRRRGRKHHHPSVCLLAVYTRFAPLDLTVAWLSSPLSQQTQGVIPFDGRGGWWRKAAGASKAGGRSKQGKQQCIL